MFRMPNRAPLLDQHRVLYHRFTETALVVADGGIAQEAQRIGDQQRETVDATTPGVVDESRRETDRAAEGRTRAADNCTSGPVRF
jgi:hypothetical protein